MSRMLGLCGAALFGALLFPSTALASIGFTILGASPFRLAISLVGLGVTMVLLVEVIMLRKVALGGAITERISYVVLSIVCLGASALAQWTANFVHGVTLEQMDLASELLVIAAMALFAAYFTSVRTALEGYLNAMTSGEILRSQIEDSPDAEEVATRG